SAFLFHCAHYMKWTRWGILTMDTTEVIGCVEAMAKSALRYKILLLIGATAFTLALTEWMSRSFCDKNARTSLITESDIFYHVDSSGVRRNLPNKTAHMIAWDGKKITLRFNSLGFRGKELELQKPSGIFRILFLGDSITMGVRVPEDSIFVEQISKNLDASFPRRYETANAAGPDIGLVEE